LVKQLRKDKTEYEHNTQWAEHGPGHPEEGTPITGKDIAPYQLEKQVTVIQGFPEFLEGMRYQLGRIINRDWLHDYLIMWKKDGRILPWNINEALRRRQNKPPPHSEEDNRYDKGFILI